MEGSTIRDLVLERDAARFSGRARELAVIERVLGDDPPATIVLVHGPGGVGKSTLLREAARRAAEQGYRVAAVDGREAEPGTDLLRPALEQLAGAPKPLLVIDTFERVASLGAHLREEVLASLPATARVLIAGRRPPDPGWSAGGWDALTLELPLGALEDDDARELLARRGVVEAAAADTLIGWSRGLPLALAVGAESAATRGAAVVGERLDDDAQMATTLLRRLAGDELEGADRDVLAVAAIATAVDARLLAAVLGVDGERAERWLRSLSFAEAHGVRITLHDRLRAALRREILNQDPAHERELRRQIADHLYERALGDEPRLAVDLAALIEDPAVRWTFSVASDEYRIDRVRPGDGERAASVLGASGARWWRGVRRFIEEAPDRVATVRDRSGALAGLCVAVTPHNAPPWAEEDPLLGPWLAHARVHRPDGNALLHRDSLDLTPRERRDLGSPVLGLLNTAAHLRSGLPNVACAYGPIDVDDERGRRMAEAIGARHIPELDAVDGERRVRCHVIEHGEDGVIGTIRSFVYRDMGLPAPPPVAAAVAAPVTLETVREALRTFHDPLALAQSPLARGGSPAERAVAVQSLLRRATAAAFGDSADERLQRATIERGYLAPDGGHAIAARELSLSRTTYFRRLAAAADRVAEFVLAERR